MFGLSRLSFFLSNNIYTRIANSRIICIISSGSSGISFDSIFETFFLYGCDFFAETTFRGRGIFDVKGLEVVKK